MSFIRTQLPMIWIALLSMSIASIVAFPRQARARDAIERPASIGLESRTRGPSPKPTRAALVTTRQGSGSSSAAKALSATQVRSPRRPFMRRSELRPLKSYTADELETYSRDTLARITNGTQDAWRSERPRSQRTIDRTYRTTMSADDVWSKLTTRNPATIWNDASSVFRVGYQADPSRPGRVRSFDAASPFRGLEPGQVLFVDLRLCPTTNLCNSGLAMVVTRVDHANKEIRFQYAEPSPAHGEQTITLTEIRGPKGEVVGTTIAHRSDFVGRSAVSQWLYQPVHDLALKQFYKALLGNTRLRGAPYQTPAHL